MQGSQLLERVRSRAGLSQEELAHRAGTSRPTLSAYEHGRKSPRLDTTERILAEAGFEFDAQPIIGHRELKTRNHRVFTVLDGLPRLPVERAFARLTLPIHLSWSGPRTEVSLAVRRARARVYEVVLREGDAHDLTSYIDGALLVDLWDDLVLPSEVRRAWQPLIDKARHDDRR